MKKLIVLQFHHIDTYHWFLEVCGDGLMAAFQEMVY